jgi:WD40 repeat protein
MLHEGRRVFSLAFSPDGKRLLTGSNDRIESSVLQVWDANSGALDGAPVTQPGMVRTVAWSGDGKLWAPGSVEPGATPQESRGGEIRFWDADLHQPHGESIRQTDGVWAVAFQPKVGLLANGTDDGIVRFWNPATRGRTGKLLQHRDRVTSMMFSRDGQILLTCGGENRPNGVRGGEARLWNVNTGQLAVQPLVHGWKVNDAALSPDQRSVVTADYDGSVYLLQVGGSTTPDFILRQTDLQRIFLTPDGGTLITIGKNGARTKFIVQHWEAWTGRALGKPLVCAEVGRTPVVEKSADAQGHTEVVGRPDGRWAAYAEFATWPPRGSTVPWFFWDTVTHEPLLVPDEVRRSCWLAFSRDSKLLAVARNLPNGEGECRVWDIERWQPLFKRILIKSPVLSLLLAANGRTLHAGSKDGIVRRWTVPDGELVSATENLGGEVVDLTLSPDGTQILSGSRKFDGSMIQLWNEADLSPVAPKYIGSDWRSRTQIQFLPGGKRYLGYNPVQVWDAASGQLRRKLDGQGVCRSLYAAHSAGAYLAMGITLQQVRLWHLDTGKWIGRTMSFPAPIDDLAISPDGAALYVSCRDGSVCRLSLPAAVEGSVPQVKSDIEALTRQRLAEDGSLVEKSSSR